MGNRGLKRVESCDSLEWDDYDVQKTQRPSARSNDISKQWSFNYTETEDDFDYEDNFAVDVKETSPDTFSQGKILLKEMMELREEIKKENDLSVQSLAISKMNHVNNLHDELCPNEIIENDYEVEEEALKEPSIPSFEEPIPNCLDFNLESVQDETCDKSEVDNVHRSDTLEVIEISSSIPQDNTEMSESEGRENDNLHENTNDEKEDIEEEKFQNLDKNFDKSIADTLRQILNHIFSQKSSDDIVKKANCSQKVEFRDVFEWEIGFCENQEQFQRLLCQKRNIEKNILQKSMIQGNESLENLAKSYINVHRSIMALWIIQIHSRKLNQVLGTFVR